MNFTDPDNPRENPSPLFVHRQFVHLVDWPHDGIESSQLLPDEFSEHAWTVFLEDFEPFEDISYGGGVLRSPLRIPGKERLDMDAWLATDAGTTPAGRPRWPAAYSGIRSTLARSLDGRLFRFKGCNFGTYPSTGGAKSGSNVSVVTRRPQNPINYVYGGQLLSRSERERAGIAFLNERLAQAGVPPSTLAAGRYRFDFEDVAYFDDPTSQFRKVLGTAPCTVVTDIFEVKGDTRADELFCMLDTELRFARSRNNLPSLEVQREIDELYRQTGELAGLQLRYIHEQGILWHEHSDSVRDYLANQLFYVENESLRLGLTDFDRCVFPGLMRSSELLARQEAEYHSVLMQAESGIISVRRMHGHQPEISPNRRLRGLYREGVQSAYEAPARHSIDNRVLVDLELITRSIYAMTGTNPDNIFLLQAGDGPDRIHYYREDRLLFEETGEVFAAP